MRKFLFLFFLCSLALLPAFALNSGRMNKLLGLEIFGKNGWRDTAENVGKRLNCQFQTTKAGNDIISTAYVSGKCMDCDLEQLKIKESKHSGVNYLDYIEFNFANKGDSGQNFQEEFKQTSHKIFNILQKKLGNPQKKGERYMWEMTDAVFIMEVAKGEFIKVTISKPNQAMADQRQAKPENVKKKIANTDFSKNVARNKNHDNYIRKIPMVNQGQKGYCGPATIERCLLYYGIKNYDMHDLARMFETDAGGGTSSLSLLTSTEQLLKKYSLTFCPLQLNMDEVKQMIDNGYPILRICYIDEGIKATINERNEKRKGRGLEQWKRDLRKQPAFPAISTGNHINLIIGYNDMTGEIAISDSWGNEQGNIRWLSLRDTKNTTLGDLLAIKPDK